jgi:hypothetical protein
MLRCYVASAPACGYALLASDKDYPGGKIKVPPKFKEYTSIFSKILVKVLLLLPNVVYKIILKEGIIIPYKGIYPLSADEL